jgi:hypothetical protein
MAKRQFTPGLRFSVVDGAVLALGSLGVFSTARIEFWWLSVIIAWVVGHFFLFCNVFRISRVPELLWGLVFIIVAAHAYRTDEFSAWFIDGAISFLATIILVVREMKKPYYHGVGWSKINPDLRTWWQSNQ